MRMSWLKLHNYDHEYRHHSHIYLTKQQEIYTPQLYLVQQQIRSTGDSGSSQGDTLNHGFCIVNAILDTST